MRCRSASRVVAAAVVVAEIAVVGHVHVVVAIVVVVLIVVVPIVRGLVDEALAGILVRADVVEASIARQRSTRLVAAAPGAAVARGVGVAESLLMRSTHHAADAGE